MPVVIREGGKQWDRNGDALECVAVIPDASYGLFYKEMVKDCVANGQYDLATMGSVANVGLMAQKAEEYGSHPTTFEMSEAGEILALAESLRFIGQKHSDEKLKALTEALDIANDGYLDNNKASHFYVAMYWADALAANGSNAELAEKFAPVAKALKENEDKIIEELLAVEGKAVDMGGYYHPNDELAEKAMRPSATLNGIIDAI